MSNKRINQKYTDEEILDYDLSLNVKIETFNFDDIDLISDLRSEHVM